LSVNVLAPPRKVGVAPSTAPLPVAIVTLWGSDEAFVKSIVTVPAFAARNVLLYFRIPLALAASLMLPRVTLIFAGFEEVLPDVVAACVPPVDDVVPLGRTDPPQPTSAVSANRTPAVKIRAMCKPPLIELASYLTAVVG
jgi:hypothetical protein